MSQTIPNHRPASEALDTARAMYRRVLASWASDLLELRRRGLDTPGPRRASTWCGPSAGLGTSLAHDHRPAPRRAA